MNDRKKPESYSVIESKRQSQIQQQQQLGPIRSASKEKKKPVALQQNTQNESKPPAKAIEVKKEKLPPTKNVVKAAPKVTPILFTNSNSVTGDGLWCYAKEPSYDSREPDPLPSAKVLKDIDSNIESSVVQFLERQCGELGKDLELERAKSSAMGMEITKLSVQNQKLSFKIKELESENENKNNLILENNNQLDSITELYNRTTRETSKISSELKEKSEKNRQLNELYSQLMKEKEEAARNHGEEIRILRDRLEELEEENEEYQSKLQVREDIGKKIEEQQSKFIKDMKIRNINDTENKIEKVSKLLEENAVLTEKFSESEILRKKFMEKNSQQEKVIKSLNEEKRNLETSLAAAKKRINDLSVLKSSNNKILEDKINKLNDNIDLLKKENLSLKKMLKGGKNIKIPKEDEDMRGDEEYDDEEVLEAVEAKPFLFGPVDKKIC